MTNKLRLYEERINDLAQLADGWYNDQGTKIAEPVIEAARVLGPLLFGSRLVAAVRGFGSQNHVPIVSPSLAHITGIEFEHPGPKAPFGISLRLLDDNTVEIYAFIFTEDLNDEAWVEESTDIKSTTNALIAEVARINGVVLRSLDG